MMGYFNTYVNLWHTYQKSGQHDAELVKFDWAEERTSELKYKTLETTKSDKKDEEENKKI